jgi:hypothetical protein
MKTFRDRGAASLIPVAVAVIAALITSAAALSAERATTIAREAYACTNWAAWREYGQASLTARGARPSAACPIRLAAGTNVVVLDEDSGEGASEIRYRGKNWFVDNQRLK